LAKISRLGEREHKIAHHGKRKENRATPKAKKI
jgi:hypothetical protein